MRYNILICEDKTNFSIIDNILNGIDDVEIFRCDSFGLLKETLLKFRILTIILNTNIVSLVQLENILSKSHINNLEVPILITNDQIDIKDDTKLKFFDIFSLKSPNILLQSKINFCKQKFVFEQKFEKNLHNMLYIDTLTKLPNRNKLIKDLQNDNIGISALAILDIKSFSSINDFYGFKVADNILRSVGCFIKDIIDDTHITLYKFPQDSYCLAYNGFDHEEFKKEFVEIIKKIDDKVFFEKEYEIDIKVIGGITFSNKNNKLATADIALNVAKEKNKNYFVFSDELDKHREFKNNMQWLKKLKDALRNDNIVVFFQPLINNKTLKVDKYECLVRMIDGDKVISPFFFLDMSKKANQYTNITKIVIRKSIDAFKNLPFEFSINVSYDDIEDDSLIDFIKEQLQDKTVAKRVVWELLEDENIKDYDIVYNFIREVKSLGCKVAIDDFGSGYSNFEHILKMDIDYLKIDASLIKNIVNDQNSYKVVKTIIQFAKNLNLKTIAEFVENENIFNFIVKLGADYSQGYYFSAPISSPIVYDFHKTNY